MKIVHVYGPSYSGSTVLGYILNSAPGYFFGSEVHRLLHSYIKRYGSSNKRIASPSCDYCGADCFYWNPDLLNRIIGSDMDSLTEIYRAFRNTHGSVRVFVDSSKKSSYFQDSSCDFCLVAAKHPVRLIASRIYNKRQMLGLATDKLDEIGKILSESRRNFHVKIDGICQDLNRIYRSIFLRLPSYYLVRTDLLGASAQEQKKLCAHLSIDHKDISFTSFLSVPAHTIGGNRAPYWMKIERDNGKVVDNPRSNYYRSAHSFGDFRVDDKYKIIFSEQLLRQMIKLKGYRDLCVMLGYSPDLAPDLV